MRIKQIRDWKENVPLPTRTCANDRHRRRSKGNLLVIIGGPKIHNDPHSTGRTGHSQIYRAVIVQAHTHGCHFPGHNFFDLVFLVHQFSVHGLSWYRLKRKGSFDNLLVRAQAVPKAFSRFSETISTEVKVDRSCLALVYRPITKSNTQRKNKITGRFASLCDVSSGEWFLFIIWAP